MAGRNLQCTCNVRNVNTGGGFNPQNLFLWGGFRLKLNFVSLACICFVCSAPCCVYECFCAMVCKTRNRGSSSQVGEGCQGRGSVFREHTQQKRLPSSGTIRLPVAVHGCCPTPWFAVPPPPPQINTDPTVAMVLSRDVGFGGLYDGKDRSLSAGRT